MSINLLAIKKYFETGETKTFQFRKQQLQNLAIAIQKNEAAILAALQKDLGKSNTEAYVSEIALVQMEIKFMLKNLGILMKPQRVNTNLLNLPASSKIYYDALGVVFIIAPWNYPFQLLFAPLVGAIAAGNCVVLKPSEFTPNTTAIAEKIIKETFPENYINIVQGDGATVVPALMSNFRFDHIFFTGSINVGKAVYTLAAKDLVPVTLELGGKSPCVVEADANLHVAAKRIAIGKFLNAGQTCIAPDYLLLHQSIKDEFLQLLQQTIVSFYGTNIEASEDYGRIINEKRFNTLISYLKDGNIIFGGKNNMHQLYIEPTILTNVSLENSIMQEEIFGPILPVFFYNTKEEAQNIIQQNLNPLAFYLFTSNKQNEDYWLQNLSFGGGCINNTVYHITNHNLPFGGVGNSGIGSYHGNKSFYTFSHAKSVLKSATWFDPALKYPPFKNKLKWMKPFFK